MMEIEPNLDSEIQHFISFHIKSVAELETLLLLFRNPSRTWSAEQLSQELRSNPSYAETLLQQLARTGLVEKQSENQTYILKKELEHEMELIRQIEVRYQKRRFSLINLIYEAPTEKIKTFADAFKLRK